MTKKGYKLITIQNICRCRSTNETLSLRSQGAFLIILMIVCFARI